jgi:hypothetical protein
VKEIPLTKGQVALVDDEDYEALVSGYKWRVHHSGVMRTSYAQSSMRGSKPPRSVLLHRLIMNAPVGTEVDHINGDGLDCQRHNLRLATHRQNKQNVAKQRTRNGIATSSRFKGVRWHIVGRFWVAQCKLNKKQVYLGCFQDDVAAALAYNAFALEHYGEFARLNEIDERNAAEPTIERRARLAQEAEREERDGAKDYG